MRDDRIRLRIMWVEMKDGNLLRILLICIIEMETDSSMIANWIHFQIIVGVAYSSEKKNQGPNNQS